MDKARSSRVFFISLLVCFFDVCAIKAKNVLVIKREITRGEDLVEDMDEHNSHEQSGGEGWR